MMLPAYNILESLSNQHSHRSRPLRHLVIDYYRLEFGHTDRNYTLLMSVVWKHIEQKRRIETRDALHRDMSGSKVLSAFGGHGGDPCGSGANGKKGACRYWTPKGFCLRGLGSPWRTIPKCGHQKEKEGT